jgi:hypothetical protein
MSRIVCTLTFAAFLAAGFVVLAGGDQTSPTNPNAVTFTAVKGEKRDKIRVTVGDLAFDVPELELKRNDKIRLFVVADNGQLNTVVPFDPAEPHRTEDLRAIAVQGKSYSLSVRQPASSAYFRQGSR